MDRKIGPDGKLATLNSYFRESGTDLGLGFAGLVQG
jgi:hypothetical protein